MTRPLPTVRRGATAQNATNNFLKAYNSPSTALGILVIVVPGVLGLFWGAPLVARELQTGTYRLAWTQSVSRRRWLLVKLGVVGLAAMATAGLLSRWRRGGRARSTGST